MPLQPNITLRQMRAFVEAYRLRNLTHAAEAMHLTQSAMSALIRQLEGELGVRLFERTPRILRPTRAAEHAYLKAEAILKGITDLGQEMRELAGESELLLSFSCSPVVFSSAVATVLSKFKRQNPGIKIVMYDALDADLIQRVIDGDAEFSIGFYEHEPEALTRTALVEDFLSAICAKNSKLAQKERVVWEDLVEESLIGLSRGIQSQQLATKALARAGLAYRVSYETSFIQTALALAAQGMGVLVTPGYLVKGNPQMSTLVAKKLHDPTIERSLLYHTRQGHMLSPPAVVFLDMLRQYLMTFR